MGAIEPHDPYLAIPGLAASLGREMIAEVEQDIPYLGEAAQWAEFGFRITPASQTTGPLTGEYEGRLPVLELASPDALADSLRPNLRAGPHSIKVWITPESLPQVFTRLGMTQGAQIAGIDAKDIEVVLAALLRSLWDSDIVANFLAFELFTTALRAGGTRPSGRGGDEQEAVGAALAPLHLEKAVQAMAEGDRSTAAGYATAAAGCFGVPREAALGMTGTSKYVLNTGNRRSGGSQPVPEDLQRILGGLSPSELQEQEDLITQAAGRLVEEGRAAWCERQFFCLQEAGFPFLRPVPPPNPISGYGKQVYRDGMKLIERAATRTSRWVFLSPFVIKNVILPAWSWLLTVVPPYVLKELAGEARVLPEDSVKAIADWEADDPHWARKLAEHEDSSNLRAAAAARRLLQ